MFSDSFVKKTVAKANRRRAEHRDAFRGWTRNKSMRSEVRVPIEFYLQPEFMRKYFPDGDEHEQVKALEMLKRDYPMFKTHD